MVDWMVREGRSEPIGPVSTELVVRAILAGRITQQAQVCRVGDNRWSPLASVPEFAGYAFDEDAETRVTDSPWFMDTQATGPRGQPRPPARPAPKLPALGLAAPVRRPAPPPARKAPVSPPRTPTFETTAVTPMAGQQAYDDTDDDVATRVADSQQFLPRAPGFEVDDQTMTHVAANAQPAAAPSQVLPTLPMPARVELPMERPVPSPRPAAGAPPAGALQQPEVSAVPPGAFPAPPAPPPMPPPEYPQPFYGAAPPQSLPQYPYVPPPRAEPHDQGLRALVALIVFLAVALAVVLILLVVRR